MNALSLQSVHITSNGNYFQVIVIGDIFKGMSSMRKQQTVYAPLMEYIMNKNIHALSIKAYTPQEWECNQKINSFKLKVT